MIVVIYGPPAAGKLTVATELAELTGFRLFHNHLTDAPVRAMFEFGSDDYARVLWDVRTKLFTEARNRGVDLIYTMNSARGLETNETVERSYGRIVEVFGDDACFVHLEPPLEVLEARIDSESRAAHGKLLDAARLREQMRGWNSEPLSPSHLSIDNSSLEPRAVATLICSRLALA